MIRNSGANTFQAFDLLLTNGLNTVTLHATDLAGNVMTTNFSFTLDYATATNPVAPRQVSGQVSVLTIDTRT